MLDTFVTGNLFPLAGIRIQIVLKPHIYSHNKTEKEYLQNTMQNVKIIHIIYLISYQPTTKKILNI